uniref:Activin_recp domain-containing protein n=1 Tax=Globodera pallida TaxID=36090 RepID=A0A183C9Y8_GLOPA
MPLMNAQLLLLCFFVLVHPSSGAGGLLTPGCWWNTCSYCYSHIRFRDGDPPQNLVDALAKLWDHQNFVAEGKDEHGEKRFCWKSSYCNTYRCKDVNGNDIFVVNGCGNIDKQQCGDDYNTLLKNHCAGTVHCNTGDICRSDYCNKDKTNLETPMPEKLKPGPKPTPFVPPSIVLEASIEKGGGVMFLCNFTFTFLLFLGGVLLRWVMEM